MNTEPQGVKQYATFMVGGFYFGIEVLDVQEVLREQRVTPVPFAPRAVEGLINLRGQIVPALDMRVLLNLPPREGGELPHSMVVRTEYGAISLQVDDIQDVLELEPTNYEPPPLNLDSDLMPLVQGVYKLEDRFLMVLQALGTTRIGASPAAQA
jgi:purine-binding chemotaxis protein CheW